MASIRPWRCGESGWRSGAVPHRRLAACCRWASSERLGRLPQGLRTPSQQRARSLAAQGAGRARGQFLEKSIEIHFRPVAHLRSEKGVVERPGVDAQTPRRPQEKEIQHQRAITGEKYESRTGRTAPALVDRSDAERGTSQARLPWQADDIDGVTELDVDVDAGTLVDVEVTGADDYDFTARVRRVISATGPLVAPPPRYLPVASMGAFGR